MNSRLRRLLAIVGMLEIVTSGPALAQSFAEIFERTDSLNTGETSLFSGSGNCVLCHTMTLGANQSQTLGDVSPVELWQATMMANAARDPLWQAKVSSESAVFPQHQAAIEDVCTTCHAPIGRTQAVFDDSTHQYSLAEMQNSPIALDGVSCTACHQIQDVGFGLASSYTGNYTITDVRKLWGPFVPQFPSTMVSFVNYEPELGAHLSSSEMCATCHTLITTAFDDGGTPVGEFFEQVGYLEWKNSVYEDLNIECQDCHMPQWIEPILQSPVPGPLVPRDTTNRHYLVGGNVFMLKLMRDNRSALGATFSHSAMDSAIARTEDMLRLQTVEMVSDVELADSLTISVFLKNLTGHKFPTGYPARRAWLHVTVKDSAGQVFFESGKYDSLGYLTDEGAEFEVHYDTIRTADQVQIYETVAGDVNGDVTHVLLKSYEHLKDNRLVPLGFLASDATWDTVRIVGNALLDPNFNLENSAEGSGTDRVTFRLPRPVTTSEALVVEVELLYQSVNARFAEHLFTFNTNEVNTFEPMYMAADKQPVQVAFASHLILLTGIESADGVVPAVVELFQNYPNPFNPLTTIKYRLNRPARVTLTVYNLLGERVRTLVNSNQDRGLHRIKWDGKGEDGLNLASGVYVYRIEAGEFSAVRKLMLVK